MKRVAILNMNKLALVGKNISHSRSPEMYRKLISSSIIYDLLDYQSAVEIPKARDLLKKYDGINITSPYKKQFLNEVQLTESAKKTGAINCLKKENGKIIGENTDYLAIVDILKKMQEVYQELEIIILGDGVMSFVTQMALESLSMSYAIFSRKLTNDFDQLNLIDHFKEKNHRPFVINTCSRDYVFSGKLPKESIFWDFNYNFEVHSVLISPKVHKYLDGLEMLERQAFYAVAFWSRSSNS